MTQQTSLTRCFFVGLIRFALIIFLSVISRLHFVTENEIILNVNSSYQVLNKKFRDDKVKNLLHLIMYIETYHLVILQGRHKFKCIEKLNAYIFEVITINMVVPIFFHEVEGINFVSSVYVE